METHQETTLKYLLLLLYYTITYYSNNIIFVRMHIKILDCTIILITIYYANNKFLLI